MAEVLLFHHAQGLTAGITAIADDLRASGHVVHVPDLYDGWLFDSLDEGVAHAQGIGFGTLIARGAEIAAGLPAGLVYLGFSLGALPAQMLAQTRPGAAGAVLCSSCVPLSEFGGHWPPDVPVQVHGMDEDPVFVEEGDVDAARHLVSAAPDGDLFLYRGDRHLFADRSLPAHDEDAARLLTERVLAFLARVDVRSS